MPQGGTGPQWSESTRRAARARILLVSNMYPSAGDPVFGSFVARQAEAFRDLGVEVHVVANRDPRSGVAWRR